jgi:tetratricopeptide (TPR) repeat protein
MSHFTRKDFIKLTSLGFLATVLPVHEVEAVNGLFNLNIPTGANDLQKAQLIAKKAKEYFYKKEFAKAEELYLQSIKLAPAYIQFYDCLSNVYGVRCNHLASVELFKAGMKKNAGKAVFCDRLAKAFIRLEKGNKNQAKEYKKNNKISHSLLEEAQKLWEKGIVLEGNKKYLQEGLSGLDKSRQKGEVSLKMSARESKKHKAEIKTQNRQKIKKELSAKSNQDLEGMVKKIDAKPRTVLFVEKEKQQQQFHIAKQKKRLLRLLNEKDRKNSPAVLGRTKQIFDLDPSDSLSLYHLKRALYANGKYFELISQRQKFAEKKNSVYGYLGVVDAIETANEKGQTNPEALSNAVSICGLVLSNFSLTEKTTVEVIDKLTKIYILQGKSADAITMLEALINQFENNSVSLVNMLLYRYASALKAAGQVQKAKEVLNIGIHKKENQDPSLSKVYQLASRKEQESFNQKKPLYHLLYEIHNALGETEESSRILRDIRQFNPSDKFATRRK